MAAAPVIVAAPMKAENFRKVVLMTVAPLVG
jgi:hypothetical protein